MKTGPLHKILGMTDLVREVSKVRELPELLQGRLEEIEGGVGRLKYARDNRSYF